MIGHAVVGHTVRERVRIVRRLLGVAENRVRINGGDFGSLRRALESPFQLALALGFALELPLALDLGVALALGFGLVRLA